MNSRPTNYWRERATRSLCDNLSKVYPGFGVVKARGMGKISRMAITLEQIVEETREMPGEVVAELVDRIMVARQGGVETSVESAWKAEIQRRIEELESGKVKGVPLEGSLARARKLAGL